MIRVLFVMTLLWLLPLRGMENKSVNSSQRKLRSAIGQAEIWADLVEKQEEETKNKHRALRIAMERDKALLYRLVIQHKAK